MCSISQHSLIFEIVREIMSAIPVAGQQREISNEEERERNIQLHLVLMMHTATCESQQCPSANCAKMKSYFKHERQCRVRGCNICRRFRPLYTIHANRCDQSKCPVPNCAILQERWRQQTLQVQQVTDELKLQFPNWSAFGDS